MSENYDDKGIPLKSGYDKMPLPPTLLYPIFSTIFSLIGFGAAQAIYAVFGMGNEKILSFIRENDLAYLYAGYFALKIGQLCMGINLGEARKASKVNIPDQQVYKCHGKGGSAVGYVLMENEGILGQFNRAQRAVQNYNEVLPMVVLSFLLAGLVFPKPVCCLASLFALARLFGAIGYTRDVEGRMGGNMLGTLLLVTIEGFLITVILKTVY
eukprot:NODE_6410_length_849_cov_227.236915_g6174_i0.p1 GENE.NODE_6410_length_849_cov_227.236915_g6174_i0~~NODE_6410_length_849_cov_227.236915_g6174_i0.p1  ORF type:complete len:212 (-),score=50.29 NODE_6410_length_849_cov_227.236915_g6174_i0:155-790(-)